MARNIILGTLVTRCAKRADKQNSGHVPPDEIKELVSEFYAELHALVTEMGARYFESEQTINATGAAFQFALPADYLSTVRVDFLLDAAGRRSDLRMIAAQETPDWSGLTGAARVYALVGANLELYPKPPAGTYKHVYVPQPVDLSVAVDGTNVDVINIWGEKFIYWGVASVAKHKSEDDQRRAMLEKDRARDEILVWAAQNRSQHHQASPVVREIDGIVDPADWNYR